MNAIGERVNEGRVLNDEARLEILQRHDTQVEEENKAKEARRVDKSRRRRDEFSVSLKCFKLGIIDWNPDSKENANKDLMMANQFIQFIESSEGRQQSRHVARAGQRQDIRLPGGEGKV